MGYALWIHDGLAIALGTHEYRPMGVAVIASSDIFTAAAFSAHRRKPPRNHPGYEGLFASIPDLNRYLVHRRSRPPAAGRSRAMPGYL
jgi:hypothetical protein